MTAPADLILTNAAVYTLTASVPDTGHGEHTETETAVATPDAEAVAIRDGRIVSIDCAYDIEFLEGVETQVVDLDGRTVLPGFVDAHTHLDHLGQREREADLGGADSAKACLDRLGERRDETGEGWILGFGYDESQWSGQPTADPNYLTRDQLDEVSSDRPVAAFREDMHLASVNSVVLDRYGEDLPDDGVHTENGEATGVLVEEAVGVLTEATRPDREGLRQCLLAGQGCAHRHGVTAVHEMVRPDAARAYRDLDLSGELTLRVRLNYWADHLDAVLEAGLATNHGSSRVRMGAIKTFIDGSIGGRTARLAEPYSDIEPTDEGDVDEGASQYGEWVTPPEELATLVERVDDAGLQMMAHAIGDEAIEAALDALDETEGERHRIEHAEVLTDDLIDRLAASDAVVSAQPNFLKWATEGGLYAGRLGDERRRDSNQFGTLAERGAQLAFGSDCMPLDPLFGIHWAVNAPDPSQALDVSDALRAYTTGGAYAGFDEERMGTLEVGKDADLVVLSESPWETDEIAGIDVEMTLVDGEIVYRASEDDG